MNVCYDRKRSDSEGVFTAIMMTMNDPNNNSNNNSKLSPNRIESNLTDFNINPNISHHNNRRMKGLGQLSPIKLNYLTSIDPLHPQSPLITSSSSSILSSIQLSQDTNINSDNTNINSNSNSNAIVPKSPNFRANNNRRSTSKNTKTPPSEDAKTTISALLDIPGIHARQ